ncbi:MAG TPA: wax ester/triacylglycerol synthase family O-acyltransferase [Solirubrobacteraceae bacterium]|jgi:WS/DGAT/MGAT family acyltransferase
MARNPDRLTALDSAFLHIESDGAAHMHVASVMVFQGDPPAYDDLVEALESRLHLVPRYRQRLADVPFDQGRPVWVDDPHFNIRYHLRHTGLPAPGGVEQLKNLAGRLFSQQLDRGKPLWEIWLVDRLEGDRFALIGKTHHALVDGVSGVDITTVLFDAAPDPAPVGPPQRPWAPSPPPSRAQLLAEALVERATDPAEGYRAVRSLLRAPRRVASQLGTSASSVGAMLGTLLRPAPPSPLNVPIGPHRRYTWVDGDLAEFKAIKNELGGTVNDVVLAAVSLAVGRWLRRHAFPTEGLELRAMVPVSVRADVERGALGNRVAAMYAPLPVGIEDPEEVYRRVHESMAGLKESGQAVGAQVITQLGDFAPPTILSQAARLQARQRWFNLVVTNVPGPQFPLYVLGHRLERLYPVVPLAPMQGLGIAIMSYDGKLGFGLLGDYEALADIEDLADDLETAIAKLARVAGVRRAFGTKRRSRPKRRSPAPATS